MEVALTAGAVVLLVVGLLAALAYAAHVSEKKRTAAMRQAAEEMGFEFLDAPGEDFWADLNTLPLFTQGRGRGGRNALFGQAQGLDVRLFDYRYTVGSGKSRQTLVHTVVCFHLPGTDLPAFSLRPENLFHKIGSWFGYQDIDFDTHPRFSSQYLLRGGDEQGVRDRFTEPVLDYFQDRRGVCVEAEGDRLVFYRHGPRARRVEPGELRELLAQGFEVLALFVPPGKK